MNFNYRLASRETIHYSLVENFGAINCSTLLAAKFFLPMNSDWSHSVGSENS